MFDLAWGTESPDIKGAILIPFPFMIDCEALLRRGFNVYYGSLNDYFPGVAFTTEL